MKTLRSIHLYLGCLFAPMLLFFAISGFWQTCDFNYGRSKMLALLSTIHTSHNFKVGGLTSPLLRDFILVMALSFIATTVLGVAMAFKFGQNRVAVYGSLVAGILFPVVVVLLRVRG